MPLLNNLSFGVIISKDTEMLRRLIVKVEDQILNNVIECKNNKIKYEKDYFRRSPIRVLYLMFCIPVGIMELLFYKWTK